MGYSYLIVDTSATVRALIKRSIRQSEMGVEKLLEAATAHEAMDVLHDHPIDLVLIDPRLPDMDGIDFIGRILAEPDTRSIPVVVMATRPDPRKMEALRRRGVKGHIRKPFSPQTFRTVVQHILEPTHV